MSPLASVSRRRTALSALLLLASAAIYAGARDRAFEARPYLAHPGEGRVAIRGISRTPSRWSVVPLTPGSPAGAESTPTTLHSIELTRLPLDRFVEVQVLEDGAPVEGGRMRFRTDPGPAAAAFDFAVLGDSGGSTDRTLEFFGATPSNGAMRRPDVIARWISQARPQLILHAGDVVYPRGERDNYRRAFFRPFGPILATAPIAAAIGNHDLKTGDGAPFLDVFQFPDAPPLGEGKYYSFNYGPLHVSVLDSNEESFDLLEHQVAWLRRDLQLADRPWKIVLCHVPLYFNGEAQRSRHSKRQVMICDTLRALAEAGGVSVVFSGHRHWYERSKPSRGVVQIVTGGGGDDVDDFHKYGDGDFAMAASVFHFVRARVQGDVMTLQPIRDDGRPVEEGGGARVFRKR
jgi:predicted phosphodiesterase